MVLAGALGLGAAHAFEVDHLAAVSAFVATRPRPRQAALFGIKWAVGHGISLLLLGSLLYTLKLTISQSVAGSLERVVGVALLGLGIWTLLRLRPGEFHHTHSHSHAHVRSHEGAATAPPPTAPADTHRHADGSTHSHPHRHGSLWMGLLHGAAGTTAFVAQFLVGISQSYLMVFAFTLAYSIGVLLAMGVYAGLLGSALSLGERRSTAILLGARVLTALCTCMVGIWWIFR